MSDKPDVLDYLRERFNRLDAAEERINAKLDDIGRRLTAVENEVGRLRTSVQTNHGNAMHRLDGFEQRMGRLRRHERLRH